jgi:hypothetical protein
MYVCSVCCFSSVDCIHLGWRGLQSEAVHSVGGDWLQTATMDEYDMQDLYSWIDELPLSRPKRHIARDFSDGVCELNKSLVAPPPSIPAPILLV